jgi:hypothetical protein
VAETLTGIWTKDVRVNPATVKMKMKMKMKIELMKIELMRNISASSQIIDIMILKIR